MTFHSLTEWLNYIESLHITSIDLGLSRISPVAKKMKLNHFDCPIIIVGGTNGKGSCVRLLESIYSKAHYRVAAYTSPHLFRFNERIRFEEKEISDEDLIRNFSAIEKIRESVPLSFFEFTTLAALNFFKMNQPDIIILEVGLGGRLDAVNVVEPDISIVVTVDIDHCDWLGTNRESIGFEKAGIFRSKKSTIYGDLFPPQSLMKHAAELQSNLYLLNRDYHFKVSNSQWTWQSPNKILSHLPLPILKIENASTALMAVELLQSKIFVDENAMGSAIKTATLPGRFECIESPITCIFDIAHNPQAARNLAQTLNQMNYSGKTFAVVGMLKDKIIDDTLHPLIPYIDAWFAGDLKGERGGSAKNIIEYLKAQQVKKCYNFSSIKEAMRSARNTCQELENKARILVFGSFYTVAQAKEELL